MSQSTTARRPRNAAPAADRKDVYQRVTDQIIEQLERGCAPWQRPWTAERTDRPLRSTGAPYKGINVLMLWMSAAAQGFTSPHWFTFNQAKELGAFVRAGSKGSLVVYAGSFTKTEADEKTGEEVDRDIPFLKGYTVFNAQQIEGLPDEYGPRPAAEINKDQRDAEADRFFQDTGSSVVTLGAQPCYVPSQDRILMPHFGAFRSAADYYATLAHEHIHWTAHPERTDRALKAKRWGDEHYAREELVAEIGAAFIGADLQLDPSQRDNAASYLDSWLKALKADNRAIFQASAMAQKAADYLHSRQPKADDQAEAQIN